MSDDSLEKTKHDDKVAMIGFGLMFLLRHLSLLGARGCGYWRS